MTHTDPAIDPGQPPEFPDEPAQTPDIEPGGAPDELPPLNPGGGDEGDSRTFDENAS